MNVRVVLAVTVAMVGLTGGVGAQQRDTVRLSPVVVTATRLPTPVDSIAASVTVLEGAALRAEGVRHVSEALRRVPGLHVVQTGSFGGTTALFMRGAESDYVKVLIDGAPVNAPGGSFAIEHLTLDNVERIEVVRGPASVLYGSDAVSGVVQIFTQRGTGAPRVDVGLRGGTYSSVSADASLVGGTRTVRYGFGFSRSTTNGILAFNNDYDNTTWSGSVQASPDERTDVALSVRYTDGEFHVPTDGSGNVVDRNAFSVNEQLVGALDIGRFLSEQVEARLLLTLNEVDGGFDDQPDGPADTLGFFGFRSVQSQTRRGVDARINVHARGAVLTAGAHLEEQNERSLNESMSEFGTSTGSLDAERLNVAGYGQIYAIPVPGLALIAGARIDANEEFGTFYTYRAGVTYRFASGTRLRGSVGRAFKEPTFFENFSTSAFAQGNPDLVPERSFIWEIAVEQELWLGRLHVGATYFDQRFRDLIQFTFRPPNPTDPNFLNVPAATARGVEIEVAARPLPALTLRTSVTGLSTKVEDPGFDTTVGDEFVQDSTLLRRPTFTLSAEVSYRLLDRATLAATVRHVGTRRDRDFATFPATRVSLDAYTVLDLAADVEFYRTGAGAALALQWRFENLFDQSYEEAFGFRAPGRRVVAGMRAGF